MTSVFHASVLLLIMNFVINIVKVVYGSNPQLLCPNDILVFVVCVGKDLTKGKKGKARAVASSTRDFVVFVVVVCDDVHSSESKMTTTSISD